MNRDGQRGTSLVELLLGLVILSAVLALFLQAVHRQQRFYAAVGLVLEQRGQLRHSASMLPAQLRTPSPAAGDLLALSDSAVELRTHLGAALVCDTVRGGGAFDVAPDETADGATLGAYADRPRAGDEAFLFDEGPTPAAADDRWLQVTVSSASPVLGACARSPLLHPVRDAARARLRVAIAAGQSLGGGVRPGTFVRFTRRARFRLYRSGASWFLGYADWNGAGFNTVQPLSGPYRPYAPPGGASGLSFRFFNASGVEHVAPASGSQVARIEIASRASTGLRVRRADLAPSGADDSAVVRVAPRNRR